MEHKLIDGVQVPLTAEEIAQRQEAEAAWSAGAFDRAMSSLRQKRNSLLSATDYLALSDNTMTAEMISYRQALRDLTEGVTTLTKVKAVTFPTKP
jgi:endonuclease/exonuclease/phosphatase family metal-dependent hydrolase